MSVLIAPITRDEKLLKKVCQKVESAIEVARCKGRVLSSFMLQSPKENAVNIFTFWNIDNRRSISYNYINILENSNIIIIRGDKMSNMGSQLISNVFKALSHPTRIQIVKLLRNGEMCVCDILPNIDSEQSNTSQHLTILKNQGIVESKKDGAKVIYSIKNNEVYEMIEIAEAIILRQIEETKTLFSK